MRFPQEILQEIQTTLDMVQKTAHPALLLLHSLTRIQEMAQKEEQNAAATTSCSNGCTCNHNPSSTIPQKRISLKAALTEYKDKISNLLTSRDYNILLRHAKGQSFAELGRIYCLTEEDTKQLYQKAWKKISRRLAPEVDIMTEDE